MAASSLVKYDNPVLITSGKKGGRKGGKAGDAKQTLTATEDILNSILPPR